MENLPLKYKGYRCILSFVSRQNLEEFILNCKDCDQSDVWIIFYRNGVDKPFAAKLSMIKRPDVFLQKVFNGPLQWHSDISGTLRPAVFVYKKSEN